MIIFSPAGSQSGTFPVINGLSIITYMIVRSVTVIKPYSEVNNHLEFLLLDISFL